MKDLRDRVTGEPFGLYFKVLSTVGKVRHDLRLYCTRFEIRDGVLCLFKDDEMYRAFAPGTWQEIATVSLLDGSEMYEEHDYQDEALLHKR